MQAGAWRKLLHTYAAFLIIIGNAAGTQVEVGYPVQCAEPKGVIVPFYDFADLVSVLILPQLCGTFSCPS